MENEFDWEELDEESVQFIKQNTLFNPSASEDLQLVPKQHIYEEQGVGVEEQFRIKFI